MAVPYPIRLSSQVQPGKPRDAFLEKQTKQIEDGLNQGLAPQSVRLVLADTTLTPDDWWILANCAAASFKITLPPASEFLRMVAIKKIDASANTVALAPVKGQLIELAASISLTAQYQVVRIISDGANWWEV